LLRKIEQIRRNWNYQLLVYVDDVKSLGENINTIKKNKEALLDSSKDVGLGVNAERTQYMSMSRHQNAGQTII
jgi:hypothetical protein